jgi:L-iditol 2-dehydrogenase
VIFGPGGIGLLTLLCTKALCSSVIMVGTNKDKQRLEMAKQLGADHILIAGEDDVANAVMSLTAGLGADVVFEATGYPPVVQQGLDVLRKCGRMVLIGIHPSVVQLDVTKMVRDAKTLIGAYGGPVTWERVISWLASDNEYARGAKNIITGRISLDDYEAAFERCINSTTIKEMFVK